jgi:hypothetical protein
MHDLNPPRSLSVTVAAVLAIITGCVWLLLSVGMVFFEHLEVGRYAVNWQIVMAVIVFVGCMSVCTLIGGFGVFFRRNWGRTLLIILAGTWIVFGFWSLRPFLWLPASLVHYGFFVLSTLLIFVLPTLAAIGWLVLLIRKKVRVEFLPPAMVQIYVNLLNEGTPCARPTQALILGNGLFELLPTGGYDPNVEHWEFRPGSIVRGKETRGDGERYLLATSFES